MATIDASFIHSDRGGTFYDMVLPGDGDTSDILNVSGTGRIALQVDGLSADEIKLYATLKETPPTLTSDWKQLTNCTGVNPIADDVISIDRPSGYRHLRVERVGAVDGAIAVTLKLAS